MKAAIRTARAATRPRAALPYRPAPTAAAHFSTGAPRFAEAKKPEEEPKQEQKKEKEPEPDTTVQGRSPFQAFVDVIQEEVRKNREWQDSVKQLGGEVQKAQDSEAMKRAKEVYERARVSSRFHCCRVTATEHAS